MRLRALAFALIAGLVGCGDPAPTSPATLAGEVLLASHEKLGASPVETAAPSASALGAVTGAER
ncbi:MAG: hypothetical protein JNK04_02055 [Myxococcales bacterium]|nr:hypothetical protein [Myxococcales bacterium]